MMGVTVLDKIQKILQDEKQAIKQLQAPNELESRLTQALQTKEKINKQKKFNWIISVASVLFIVIISSQYQVIAYYGKKLTGYEQLTNQTLAELNEQEYMQIVDRTYELNDGTAFTIDGIMTDENQSIIYFTHSLEDFEQLSVGQLTGFLSNSKGFHGSEILDEQTGQIRGVFHYDAVSPFAKRLILHVSYKGIDYSLEFPYDAKQALATKLKKTINRKVEMGTNQLTFKKMIVTPTQTVIHGTFTKDAPSQEQIYLLVNEESYEVEASSANTKIFKNTFTLEFDSLPEQIDSLALKIDQYPTFHKVDEIFPISKDEIIHLDQEEVTINDVRQVNKNIVELTITTAEDVILTDVYSIIGKEQVELQQTINYKRHIKDGKKLVTRTLQFEMKQLPTSLKIGGYQSLDDYYINEEIKIGSAKAGDKFGFHVKHNDEAFYQ